MCTWVRVRTWAHTWRSLWGMPVLVAVKRRAWRKHKLSTVSRKDKLMNTFFHTRKNGVWGELPKWCKERVLYFKKRKKGHSGSGHPRVVAHLNLILKVVWGIDGCSQVLTGLTDRQTDRCEGGRLRCQMWRETTVVSRDVGQRKTVFTRGRQKLVHEEDEGQEGNRIRC